MEIFPQALPDFVGKAAFTDTIDIADHPVVGGDQHVAPTVQVTTIDQVSQHHELSGVTLLKVDAEGFDESVLRGATSFLARELPVVIVEIWSGGIAIRSLLSELGYRAFGYSSNASQSEEIDEVFRGDANFIFVHYSHFESVRTRLAAANAYDQCQPSVRWLRPQPIHLPNQ